MDAVRVWAAVAAVALGAVVTAGVMTGGTAPGAPDQPVAAPTAPDQPGAQRRLTVLLTNDDGWQAPGIVAVREALLAAGHDVVVVAPDGDRSGSGARAASAGVLELTAHAVDVYAVGGSPADAAGVGLTLLGVERRPDVVISGANAGLNMGAATLHSGTVGAAVTALADGVPAIAVSTEVDAGSAPFEATAELVVELLAALVEQAGDGPLLPPGLGLNVNYPVVADGGRPQVVAARTGRAFADADYLGATPLSAGKSVSVEVRVERDDAETVLGADTTAVRADRVAITVIEADFDAAGDDGLLERLVARLAGPD